MSDEQTNPLRELLEEILEIVAAKLSETDRQTSPEIMASVVVEYLSSQSFWNDEMKAKMRQAILPAVRAWFDRQ